MHTAPLVLPAPSEVTFTVAFTGRHLSRKSLQKGAAGSSPLSAVARGPVVRVPLGLGAWPLTL